MVGFKHYDRKINMHQKTYTCSWKYPLHLVKFADSGYFAFFFSQLVFNIMKVVNLKMVTNMYRDHRSQCASGYP